MIIKKTLFSLAFLSFIIAPKAYASAKEYQDLVYTDPEMNQFMANKAAEIVWSDLDKRLGFGETALGEAISWKQLGLAERLLKAGANPNKYFLTQSPLSVAVMLSNLQAMQLLLEHGANPNLYFGLSPIVSALYGQYPLKAIELLIAYDADINADSTGLGSTALNVARRDQKWYPNMAQVVPLLEKYAPFKTAKPEDREKLNALWGQTVLQAYEYYQQGYPKLLAKMLQAPVTTKSRVESLFKPEALAAIKQDLIKQE